jgi:hypothetical protein
MSIASELHKTEEELAHWPIQRIAEWIAFFRLRNKEIDRASKNPRTVMTDGKSSIVEHL